MTGLLRHSGKSPFAAKGLFRSVCECLAASSYQKINHSTFLKSGFHTSTTSTTSTTSNTTLTTPITTPITTATHTSVPLSVNRITTRFLNIPTKSSNKAPKHNNKNANTSTKALFVLQNVRKILQDDRILLDNINLSFLEGAKIGIVGPNGVGKSTLLKIIAGIDTFYEGEAIAAKGIKVGYLAQEPDLDPDKTVKENIIEGVKNKKAILDKYEELTAELEHITEDDPDREDLEKLQDKLYDQIENGKLWDLNRKIERAIEALRCPAGDSGVETLSGGERRRVALCRLLVSQPDVLLLDEPTNHLDAESVAWLERFLHDYKGCVLAITHDRYFLENVCGWILEIDKGKCNPFKGNYTLWLESRQARAEVTSKKESALQKRINEELEWLKTPTKGRAKKNKAREERYEQMVESAHNDAFVPGAITIPPGPRLGNIVLEVNKISKSFEDRILFSDVSFTIPRASVVGVIGPNGSGKTTLFNILTGEAHPDEGTVKYGDTAKLGYVSQSRDQLNPDHTVWQEVSEGGEWVDMGNGRKINSRVYVAQFAFTGTSQEKLVGRLSGGERNRLHLARIIKRGCNVLLLDEPTNDLDVDVLRNLETSIAGFPGVAIIISHDRYFLDRIATHIIAFEGDSNVVFFSGNYSEYEEDRQRRLGKKYDPKRIKYRKLEKI